MKSQTKKLLLDIWQAGQSIRSRCSGHSFAEYEEDRWFRRTLEREFEIIGEALNRLSQVDPDTAELISELPRIVGFRNRIIHGYDTVDDATVWGIAESHLPRLLDEVKNLIGPDNAYCIAFELPCKRIIVCGPLDVLFWKMKHKFEKERSKWVVSFEGNTGRRARSISGT